MGDLRIWIVLVGLPHKLLFVRNDSSKTSAWTCLTNTSSGVGAKIAANHTAHCWATILVSHTHVFCLFDMFFAADICDIVIVGMSSSHNIKHIVVTANHEHCNIVYRGTKCDGRGLIGDKYVLF